MQRSRHKTDTTPFSLYKNYKLFPFCIKFTPGCEYYILGISINLLLLKWGKVLKKSARPGMEPGTLGNLDPRLGKS